MTTSTTAGAICDGSLASCGAVLFSNPFEVVKNRLQLQGELQARAATTRHYRGIWHGLYVVGRNEGARGLQKGLGAALAYQTTFNGLRFGLYDPCKAAVGSVLPPGFACSLAAGVGLGVTCNFATSPLFMIKTRMQAHSGVIAGVGAQHEYATFVHGLRDIHAKGGVRALWKGAPIAAMRTAVFSGVQLSAYDTLKLRLGAALGLEGRDVRLHLVSSFFGSALMAVCVNPVEVVMTRVYNNGGAVYSANLAKSFALVAKAEGVAGLFKGTTALWARFCPHTVLTFVFLERLRALRQQGF